MSRCRLVAWAVAVLFLLLTGCSTSSLPSSSPTPTPSRVSIEAALDQMIVDGSASYANTQAVVVSRGGRTLAERYYDANAARYADVQSVTKSVLSTLVGIALADGELVSVNQTVGELLPQHRSVMSAKTAAITVRQLLTMNASWADLPEGVTLDRPGLVRGLLAAGPDSSGTFSYNNAAPHVLAAILVHATGEPLLDYARTKLFDPLGIVTEPAFEGPLADEDDQSMEDRDFGWLVDRDGLHAGYAALRLTAGDLVKIGELYRHQGQWQGKQIVPASWVAEATSPKQPGPTDGYGYGYLWWIAPIANHQTYAAFGMYGQMVMVVPDLELVIAMMSRPTETPDMDVQPMVRLVEGAIIPHLP